MAGSVSSDDSNNDYSGQNEVYAFVCHEDYGPSSRDTKLEVEGILIEGCPFPARPQMVQPLAVILPQIVAGHDSREDGDTLTTILRHSKQLGHVEEAGLSTRVNLEKTGSTEELFGEEHEEEEEEDGGERVDLGEEASTSQLAAAGSVKPKEAKLIAARHRVKNAVNITVDGQVSVTPCILTEKDLNGFRTKYGRMEGVMLRLPADNEVTCSNVSPEGMRLMMWEKPLGQLYLVAMFVFYGLSPGQISANSFADLAGFWAFMY